MIIMICNWPALISDTPLPPLPPPPLKRGREKELRKEGKNETIKRKNEQLTQE
jgi:hypothetical protein